MVLPTSTVPYVPLLIPPPFGGGIAADGAIDQCECGGRGSGGSGGVSIVDATPNALAVLPLMVVLVK